ncbi:MAG: hypothetical protein JO257_26035 [Deltaproteobacteria bacterium]|nr:hypothetical protein [Deltaproteobacteria bacterium]
MRVALLLALAACSDKGHPSIKPEQEHQRRVIEPPTGGVRALPPHAIRADGVGPYRLGTSLVDLLGELPGGPRIVQFNLPGIVHRDVLRAEDDAILIGGEPQGKASFVAVVRDEIARTESNLHVGSTRDDVTRTLGAPVDDPDRARDPRVIVPSGMRNLHVVIEGDQVVALVVTEGAAHGAAPGDAGSNDCQRPAPDPEKPHSFGACMSGGGELVSYEGDELSITAKDGHIATPPRMAGLQFAVALRGADGKDEVVEVARTDEASSRTWSLAAFRMEGLRLVRSVEPTAIYQLTAGNARWIGADLHDLDLYLELASRPDAIEVGGLLTTRAGDKIRDIVVISPASVARRRAKSLPAEAADAGVSDAIGENGSDRRSH